MLDGRRLRALDESQPDALEHLGCGSVQARWAVCQTHPQSERWALANLQRQGFTAYLPLHTVLRRDPVLRTMTRQVEAPLFTSYVFVQPGTHWAPIQHTLGVRCLLMTDGKPGHVDAGVLSVLQAGEASRRSIVPPGTLYAAGEAVSLRTGALAGHQGVVITTTPTHAVVALILLGGLRRVTVRLDALTRPAA